MHQATRRYRDDPRWITAKYPGVCKTCGGAIQKGEDIFFWPKGRKGQKIECEDCGEVSSARFEAEAFDEDVLGGFASKSKKKSFRRNAGVTADGWVLHFYDEKRNSDKFYAQLVIDDVEIRNWGRVGTDGRISVKYWSDPIEAIEEADKQRASKTRKGYEVLEDREVYVNTATVLRVQEGNVTPEDLDPLFENVVFPQPVTARAENMQTKRRQSIRKAVTEPPYISVWVGDLAAYNDGRLIGDWFELPVDDVTSDIVDEVLLSGHEEVEIFDYETNLPGFSKFIQGLGIEELNELAEVVLQLNAEQIEVFLVALDDKAGASLSAVDVNELLSLIEAIEAGEFIYIRADTPAELADEHMEMAGEWDEIPDHIHPYINLHAYGQDMLHDFIPTPKGYVQLLF